MARLLTSTSTPPSTGRSQRSSPSRFALGAALALALCAAPANAGETWGTDFKRATEDAKRQRVPILLFFTGSDWCGWCKKLRKESLDTNEFRVWSRLGAVLVEVDFPKKTVLAPALKAQNERLSELYKVKGYPTVYVVDWKGTPVARLGYEEKDWLVKAKAAIEKNFDARTGLSKTQPEGQPAPTGGGPATPTDPKAGPRGSDGVEPAPRKPRKPQKDAGAASGAGWLLDHEQALAEAGRTKLPVLAFFTCSDRGPSKDLAAIFASDEFKDWAEEAVVRLEVDFPTRKRQSPQLKLQNVKLKNEHDVDDLPAVVFLGSDGRVLTKLTSGPTTSASEWVAAAKAALLKAGIK